MLEPKKILSPQMRVDSVIQKGGFVVSWFTCLTHTAKNASSKPGGLPIFQGQKCPLGREVKRLVACCTKSWHVKDACRRITVMGLLRIALNCRVNVWKQSPPQLPFLAGKDELHRRYRSIKLIEFNAVGYQLQWNRRNPNHGNLKFWIIQTSVWKKSLKHF